VGGEHGHHNPPAISLDFFDLASPFASLEELLPGQRRESQSKRTTSTTICIEQEQEMDGLNDLHNTFALVTLEGTLSAGGFCQCQTTVFLHDSYS
jgi:hypothetical protein